MPTTRRALFWTAYVAVLLGWNWFLGSFLQGEPPSTTGSPAMQPQARAQPLASPSPTAVPPPPHPPHPHPPHPPPPLPPPPPRQNSLTCNEHEHTEYDGAVMVPGMGDGATNVTSVAECCDLCRSTRGCNVWVACTHAWCGKQCWLRWVEDPSKPAVRARGGETPWTSGTLQKDVPSEQRVASEAALDATRIVALHTAFGDLRIRLRPEWHLPSARFVQRAALGDFCTVKCELYRAEPGFLLQGALRALVEPNTRCRSFSGGPKECTDPKERPGGSMMEKGDVAWAGGSAGPDFFIMMSRNGFGASHTVWGSLADQQSMDLALRLVQGQSHSKPGTMRMLAEPIRFTLGKEDGAYPEVQVK